MRFRPSTTITGGKMSGQNQLMTVLAKLQPQTSDFPKIRVGSMGDGGYVLPDDLDGLSAVLSLGVGGEVSFDAWFADRGVPIYQYDPTVDGPPTPHPRFEFSKLAWAPTDGDGGMSLDGMMRRHGLDNSNDVLLKFDTEGAEWSCLPAISPERLKQCRLIVCELHGLNNLQVPDFLRQFSDIVNMLTRYHTVVHLHANNCCGMSLVEGVPVPAVIELTLLRNDRSDSFVPSTEPIPGPLDYPSMTDRPDLVLRPFG